MKYLTEYEQFNEEISWKGIKRVSFYIFMAAVLGWSFTPKQYKDAVIQKTIRKAFIYELKSFDNVKLNLKLKKAIDAVISKVENSNNIFNKKEITDRIRNVRIKNYEKAFIVDSDGRMFYYYDKENDVDYVVIVDESFSENIMALTHELNHLIDQHKVDKSDVDLNKLLVNPTRSLYINYFKDYPILNSKILKANFTQEKCSDYIPDTDTCSLGDMYYALITVNGNYYLSESEIYARLASLKAFLVNKNFMDIDEKINKRMLDFLSIHMIEVIEKENWESGDITTFFSMFDFYIYLPIINFDKLDDINLIAIGEDNTDPDVLLA